MRKWCVDIEGLLGDALLFVGRTRCERTHVVQPISQLDDEHPQVARHCHQHFAHGGCLLCFLRIKLQAVELGYAIDNAGNFITKNLGNLRQRKFGVFYRIVQERSDDRGLIQANVGNHAGHSNRMRDVRLPRGAGLVTMCFTRHVIRTIDRRNRTLGVAPLIRR